MLTVVIGTGYTGNRILLRLANDSAIGLSRSSPGSPQSGQMRIINLDRDLDKPIELPGVAAIIYTVPPSDHSDNNSDEDLRLRRLMSALTPAPARIVYISTTGVYGHRDGELVDEQTTPRPGNARSVRRLAAEQLLQQIGKEQGIEVVLLRVPGIYGPDRLGVQSIRDGSPVLLESDVYPGNRIHVTDLVSCCIRATDGAVPPGIYNVGDGDQRSSTWFAHEVARQCSLPARPEISRADALREFSPLRMSFLSESRRIDTHKMREVLGVIPRYANAEDGIRASLVEMSERAPGHASS